MVHNSIYICTDSTCTKGSRFYSGFSDGEECEGVGKGGNRCGVRDGCGASGSLVSEEVRVLRKRGRKREISVGEFRHSIHK